MINQKQFKRGSAILLILAMLLTLVPMNVWAVDVDQGVFQENLKSALGKGKAYFIKTPRTAADVSSYYWELSALRSAGIDFSTLTWVKSPWDPDSIWRQGKADEITTATEYAGFILGSLALGEEPAKFGEGASQRDLIAELTASQQGDGSFGDLYNQVWAMVALQAAAANYDEQKAIQSLLTLQNEKGQFVGPWGPDVDASGWALIALAPHRGQQDVDEAIERTISYFHSIQAADGQFIDSTLPFASENANTQASVISGLVAVEEDLASTAWSPNGYTALDALLQFQLADGSFSWSLTEQKSNGLATIQAVIALGDLAAQLGITDVPTHGQIWQGMLQLPQVTKVYTVTASVRVEGTEQTLVLEPALRVQTIGEQPTAYHLIVEALKQNHVDYQIEDGDWGKYIVEIAGEKAGRFGGYDGWIYLVNDQMAAVGIGEQLLKNDDQITVYYGMPNSATAGDELNQKIEQMTLLPQITLEPVTPVAGAAFQVEVKGLYQVWAADYSGVENRSTPVADAIIEWNGKSYTTNEAGYTEIPGPEVTTGTHTLQVSKDVAGSFPRLLRTEQSIAVAASSGNEQGSDVSGGETTTITLSVDKGKAGGALLHAKQLSFKKGDTAYSVLERALPGRVKTTGYGEEIYVEAIDGLGEFERGAQSGWMYMVNGSFPNRSAGSYYLRPGDEVVWRYTTDLGRDIGGDVKNTGSEEYLGKEKPVRKYSTVQADVEKLTIASDNKIPVQAGQETVVVVNQAHRMTKEEATALAQRMATHRFTLKQVVSPVAGALFYDDEVEVEILVPSLALEKKTELKVKKLKNHHDDAVVSGVYEMGPKGTQFKKPILLTIKVPLLVDDLTALALVWRDEEQDAWIPIPAVVDAERGYVTGLVDHFTQFAVIDKRLVKATSAEKSAPWQHVLKATQTALAEQEALSDWELIGLAQAGESALAPHLQRLEEMVKAEQGEFRKVTDVERMVLALTVNGHDPRQVAGYDLVEKIYNHERMTMQGTNGPVFALIALDSGAYQVPAEAQWTREKLLQWLLGQQNEDGGFPLSKENRGASDVDITAMVLQALAPYQEEPRVQEAVKSALAWLSAQQLTSGGFKNMDGEENSESSAQVLIALASLGIDPQAELFTKQNGDPLQHLLTYATSDGGFSHLLGEGKNRIATEQAFLAFVAYERWHTGQAPLYQLNKREEQHREEEVAYLDAEQISPWARAAVAKASSYGLMRGVSKEEPRFEPQRALTRAEFATLLSKWQGERKRAEPSISFHDVAQGDWFYDAVMQAATAGWVHGVGADHFAPARSITREEVAVIVARVLQLETGVARSELKDLQQASAWATAAIQQLHANGIMVGADGYFSPKAEVSREMAAVLLVRLYEEQGKRGA